MKKLQNNFTTPEQSKRLLELGVPADSADCYMKLNGTDIMLWDQPNRHTMSLSEFISRAKERAGSEVYIPCWSVGRLIEIYEYCTDEKFQRESSVCNLMADCIRSIQLAIKENRFDFSKLEE